MITENVLQIYSAGVARPVATKTIEKWNSLHPELPAKLTVTGSVDLIRRCLAGEHCDVLIVADDKIIQSMLMPEYAEGCIVFGGNKMVVSANEGYQIDSTNWIEKLTDPQATFDHHSPYGDPGGYRSVMAMMLSEKVQPGLADKLLNHPGHFGMDKTKTESDYPSPMYSFGYYSAAASKDAPFAEFPDCMNLSKDELADEYAKVTFDVDEENTVKGTPISHGITLPKKNAKFIEEAKSFISLFMENDFAKFNYIPKYEVIGKDIRIS